MFTTEAKQILQLGAINYTNNTTNLTTNWEWITFSKQRIHFYKSI